MGRQIQILMNAEDEELLLSFLRSTAKIRIFELFAPTVDELVVDQFNPEFVGHHTYDIWNIDFPWQPQYGTVGSRAHDPSAIGWRYVSNSSDAPLLEVSRTNPRTFAHGRLYWAKNFAAPHGLSYDAAAFSSWIDKIWRWVRKHGTKLAGDSMEPYALPGALGQIAHRQQDGPL